VILRAISDQVKRVWAASRSVAAHAAATAPARGPVAGPLARRCLSPTRRCSARSHLNDLNLNADPGRWLHPKDVRRRVVARDCRNAGVHGLGRDVDGDRRTAASARDRVRLARDDERPRTGSPGSIVHPWTSTETCCAPGAGPPPVRWLQSTSWASPSPPRSNSAQPQKPPGIGAHAVGLLQLNEIPICHSASGPYAFAGLGSARPAATATTIAPTATSRARFFTLHPLCR
jgi:hypothetical protein